MGSTLIAALDNVAAHGRPQLGKRKRRCSFQYTTEKPGRKQKSSRPTKWQRRHASADLLPACRTVKGCEGRVVGQRKQPRWTGGSVSGPCRVSAHALVGGRPPWWACDHSRFESWQECSAPWQRRSFRGKGLWLARRIRMLLKKTAQPLRKEGCSSRSRINGLPVLSTPVRGGPASGSRVSKRRGDTVWRMQ